MSERAFASRSSPELGAASKFWRATSVDPCFSKWGLYTSSPANQIWRLDISRLPASRPRKRLRSDLIDGAPETPYFTYKCIDIARLSSTFRMLSSTWFRSARGLSRLAPRTFTTTARQLETKTMTPTSPTESPVPKKESQPPTELSQAPNRKEIWSRSQRPRQEAMTGPRFEQTDFDLQVRPPVFPQGTLTYPLCARC